LVSALRNLAEYRDVPLVILSGLDGPAWPVKAIAAGATRFLHKTDDWNDLVEIVKQLILAPPPTRGP
jgi:DNA-binding NarL/FixJ family response regulator